MGGEHVSATAVSPRLVRLVDDAAIFPPGNAPLDAALAAHIERRATARGAVVGAFVVDDGRLGALLSLAATADELRAAPLELAVVAEVHDVEAVVAAVDAAAGVRLVAVELRPAIPADPVAVARQAAGMLADRPEVRRWVELGADGIGAIGAVAATGAGIKLRTGGLDPAAVPAPEVVAAVLVAAAEAGGTVKFTAGLHQALRGSGAGEVIHHGFVNLVLAAAAAEVGDAALAERLVATSDVGELRRRWGDGDDAGGRRLLHSFGSCSIDEPLDSALAAGVALGAALDPGAAPGPGAGAPAAIGGER